jgi:tetratricopeptide (TPR) repeat protein
MRSAVILLVTFAAAARAGTWDDTMFTADRYRAAGEYTKAVEMYRTALSQTDGDRQQATTANNLASLYAELGRNQEARGLYRQALDIWERTLAPDAPEVATTLNNLGALCAAETRYREAAYYYRRALAIEAQPATLNNLAEMYRAEGRWREAERMLRQLIEKLPDDNPTLGAALHNLGELCQRKGRAAEAGQFYRRALAVWERTLGPDHPYKAATLKNLAEVESGKKSKAAASAFR